MFKRLFYKHQLKKWEENILSIELALEYCNLPDGDEADHLMQAYKESLTITEALKLLVNRTVTRRDERDRRF